MTHLSVAAALPLLGETSLLSALATWGFSTLVILAYLCLGLLFFAAFWSLLYLAARAAGALRRAVVRGAGRP